MQLPKLAVFDMDGLLFDTERVLMEENAVVMAEHGYTQDYDEYVQTIGTADEEFFGRLYEIHGPDYPAHEIAEASRVREIERMKREGVPVKPGIPELLQFFRDREIPCCVATSTIRSDAEALLELAGVADFFSYVVTSEELAAFRAGIPVICIPDIKQPEPYYAEKATKVVPSALDVPTLFDLH